MLILDEIIAHKRREVAEKKALYPVKLLERSSSFDAPVVSLVRYLQREQASGIIAEFKRRSPSRGIINAYASAEKTTVGYMQAGASALSVLTDATYFGGSSKDLEAARRMNFCPILRKDFIIDEYQLFESRAMGADVVLLIAEALTAAEVKQLAKQAAALGLEVLLEIHSREQLDKYIPEIALIGINNRDLQTFRTDVNRSFELAGFLPSHVTKISESGIADAQTMLNLRLSGYHGFLIGDLFMRETDPARACLQLVNALKRLQQQTRTV
jgi:indole-3-glycerol phosphate synthase